MLSSAYKEYEQQRAGLAALVWFGFPCPYRTRNVVVTRSNMASEMARFGGGRATAPARDAPDSCRRAPSDCGLFISKPTFLRCSSAPYSSAQKPLNRMVVSISKFIWPV